ncbi:potassium-transporting ATPase subunit KdpA, partial [Leucobacter sp. M11]|uniref:potassium-transporting ATPase subunit KdpA n=1 Tax=Leucobacter sp. M11 TaxID=2993565 RepID=UPI002D7EE47A
MTPGWAGALQAATLALILIVAHRPVGDYLARTFTSARDWRIERGVYRLLGVDPTAEQSWQAYLRGVLLFSLVGLLFVYALQRAQAVLPGALGLPAVPPDLAFNTAASFLGNTNWQSYAPEATVGYLVQLTGLAVQNFL